MSAVTSSIVLPLQKKPGSHAERNTVFILHWLFAFVATFLFARGAFAQSADGLGSPAKPDDAPADWKQWLGDYGANGVTLTIGESNGDLIILSSSGGNWATHYPPFEHFDFVGPQDLKHPIGQLKFTKSKSGLRLLWEGNVLYKAVEYGVNSDHIARVKPLRPVNDLRNAALAAQPPTEKGPFRVPDLVELASLDAAFHLDIRYATSNDFLGVPVYTQARAFLQRPAAESLLRVLQKLKPLGYGLLIHDGYRPWYVTKIFWDATPPEGKIFVADPAQGSRHNRGCAVDLTLYDLKTGQPIEMTGAYDEMSPRSFPNYPGGTSLQRWHRDLLRRAMESEGFTVYESEWWHFDYKDWHEYGILNIPFEKLNIGANRNEN
jgi:D-alanyl-D-alanine dipeptidase